jgi:Cu-processing system ATP-binding protein
MFGNNSVLNDINLDFTRNQCIGLIGPNACGKTTLIKCLLGMVIPSKGDIIIDGHSVIKAVDYKNKIGYMPQIGRYPENMSILQVINMIKCVRNFQGQLDEELWYAFGLDKMSHKKMSTLSGGTTQKVSATIAFLFNPQILILDEPTAGLDPISAEILREKISKEKNNGKLILITSHLLSELDDLLSHIVFMQDGHIVFYETIYALYEMTGQPKISKAISELAKKSSL